MKNCDLGLENAALGLRPRAAFSRPRSQFFTIRTSQPANNINTTYFLPSRFYMAAFECCLGSPTLQNHCCIVPIIDILISTPVEKKIDYKLGIYYKGSWCISHSPRKLIRANEVRQFYDHHDAIVKLRFQNDFRPHENEQGAFSNPPVWLMMSVFAKLRFRNRLVWTVDLSVEIKLRF